MKRPFSDHCFSFLHFPLLLDPLRRLFLLTPLFFCFALSAQAQLYWKTSAANSWTGSFWSTAPGGPYTSAWVSGSNVVFEDNVGTTLTVTYASTTVGNMTVNENTTFTTGGTFGTGGNVVTMDVLTGKTLTFGSQGISTGAGTGFIKNGGGTWSLTGSAYTGGLTINAGTIAAGGINATGAGALVINGGGIRSTNTSARDFSTKHSSITIGGDFFLGDTTNTGALTFSGPTSLGAAVRNITVNSTVNWSGVITGGGGITKLGSGTLTLTGANEYTGTTTISAGTLRIGNGGTTGSLSTSSAIVTDATLVFERSNTITQGVDFATGISGTGGITQAGSGTTILSGANSYAGTTSITAGVLDVGTISSGALGSGGLIVNNAVLQGNGAFSRTLSGNATPAAGQISSNGGGFAARGGTLTVTLGASATDTLLLSSSGFRFGNMLFGSSTADSPVVVLNPISTNGNFVRTFTVNSGVGGDYAELQGGISSTGSVIKAGTGLLILSGAGTYSGATTISAGTLQIGAGGSTGTLSGTSGITNNATLAFNRTGTLAMSAPISGSGVVNQIGTGIVTLSGANSYSGGTNVNSGTLTYLNTGARPATGTTTVAAGATLGLGVATSGSFFTSADIDNLFAGTMTNVTNDAASRVGIDTTAGNFTYGTSIASTTRGLTKLGTNTLTLTGTNAYTGMTTIAAGTLDVGDLSAGALGSGGLFFSGNGVLQGRGTFSRSTSSNATPGAGQVAGAIGGFAARDGALTVNIGGSGATLSLSSGSFRFGDNLVFGSSTSNSPVIFVNPISTNGAFVRDITVNSGLGGDYAELQGGISSTGSIVKAGTGLLVLTAASTYTGSTTISGGTLQLGIGTGGGTSGSISTTSSIVNNATLAINRSNSLAIATVISGTGVVNQIGSGTTTLSAANTYSGGTSVTAGSLLITNTKGSGTGTGSVTTASGTTLGGAGTIAPNGSNSVILGGSVSPGITGAAGTLTFTPADGNVTFQNTSSIAFELFGNGNNDKLVVAATGAGLLDVSSMTAGSIGVTFVGGYTPALGHSFDLLDWNGVSGLSTSLLNLSTAGFDPSWVWDTSLFTTNGTISIALVPEPSRGLMLMIATGAVLQRRRRA
jgi:autotransporter-associated beta strand protein